MTNEKKTAGAKGSVTQTNKTAGTSAAQAKQEDSMATAITDPQASSGAKPGAIQSGAADLDADKIAAIAGAKPAVSHMLEPVALYMAHERLLATLRGSTSSSASG